MSQNAINQQEQLDEQHEFEEELDELEDEQEELEQEDDVELLDEQEDVLDVAEAVWPVRKLITTPCCVEDFIAFCICDRVVEL